MGMALDKRNREWGAKGDEALIKERMRKGLGGLRLRGEGGRTGYRPFAVKGEGTHASRRKGEGTWTSQRPSGVQRWTQTWGKRRGGKCLL